MVAHGRVDGVGKVDGGGAGGQTDHLPLGGKHKNLVGRTDPPSGNRTNSSASVSCWLSSRLAHPLKGVLVPLTWELASPSLYFQWAAMPYSAVWCISQVRICTSKGIPSGADDGGVKGLVQVGLGGGDVVLEPAGNWVDTYRGSVPAHYSNREYHPR